jgi:hypothetical protein
MPKCKSDQIYNPETEKCVKIKGAAGQKLIAKYNDGDVELEQEDIDKIENPPVAGEKKKKMGAKEKKNITDLINQYKKLNLKIKDLEIPLAEKKIYKAEQQEIKAQIANALPDLKFVRKPLPKRPKPLTQEELDKLRGVKSKLLAYVKAMKDRKLIKYVNDEHKLACKDPSKPNLAALKDPVQFKTVSEKAELQRYENAASFKIHDLDKPKVNYFKTNSPDVVTSYNNYNQSLSLYLYDPREDYKLDLDWVNEVNNYVKTLSTEDVFTVLGYTFHGDQWVNNYMRGLFKQGSFYIGLGNWNSTWGSCYMPLFYQCKKIIRSPDFFPDVYIHKNVTKNPHPPGHSPHSAFKPTDTVSEVLNILMKDKSISNVDFYCALYTIATHLKAEFWFRAMEIYIEDLNRIVKSSPPLKKKLVVFRGVKSDYYLKGTKDNFYTNKGFVSTTLSTSVALGFSGKEKDAKCCVKRCVVLPGARLLFISGLSKFFNETELLMPTDSVFFVQNAKKTVYQYSNPHDKLNDICGESSKLFKIYVTDIVVVK